jgi:UDP-N-acetylglucosamine/UDP-N-acetylgalactosamine diphosphorylase
MTKCLDFFGICEADRSREGAPKGTFSILGKSLFQWLCEKAPVHDFPIAIMTSPGNHAATVRFFKQHENFGREIYFFQQETLPFLDDEGNAIASLPQAPNGNGGLFRAFARSSLVELFREKGIEAVSVIPIDNPLAHPADLRLFGQLQATQADVVVQCVLREDPKEALGALVEREGKIEIVEYFDLSSSATYFYSYTGTMVLSLSFLLSMQSYELPLHRVRKRPPGCANYVWKQEKFIFDALPFANRTIALSYPRRLCYAPLKSLDMLPAIENLMERSLQSSL